MPNAWQQGPPMSITNPLRGRWAAPLLFAVGTASLLGLAELSAAWQQQQDVPADILKAEDNRIAVIEKVKPSVVAVFAHNRKKGGGSGVLISEDGYALTNFHV